MCKRFYYLRNGILTVFLCQHDQTQQKVKVTTPHSDLSRKFVFTDLNKSIRKGVCLFLLATLAVLSACHPIRTNTSNNNPATLVFGQGGGTTGKYLEYTLISDGTLYRNELETGNKVFMKKIRKDDSRWFFVDAEALKLLTMDFNCVYNINYYIIYIKGPRSNKVNWGNSATPPPDVVKSLWEQP